MQCIYTYLYIYIYTHLCTLRNIERPNLGLVILVLGNTQCIKLESLQKGTPLVQDQIEPHPKLVKWLTHWYLNGSKPTDWTAGIQTWAHPNSFWVACWFSRVSPLKSDVIKIRFHYISLIAWWNQNQEQLSYFVCKTGATFGTTNWQSLGSPAVVHTSVPRFRPVGKHRTTRSVSVSVFQCASVCTSIIHT